MSCHQDLVEPRAVAGGPPAPGGAIVAVPGWRVTPAVPARIRQALHVLDQGSGEAHLGAGIIEVPDGVYRVLGIVLVVVDAVILVEDVEDAALGVAKADGFVSGFVTGRVPGTAVRPVDGL